MRYGASIKGRRAAGRHQLYHLGAPTAWHTGTRRFLNQYVINTGTSRGTGMLIRDLQLPLRTPASPNTIASTQEDFVLLIKHVPMNNWNHCHGCCSPLQQYPWLTKRSAWLNLHTNVETSKGYFDSTTIRIILIKFVKENPSAQRKYIPDR